MEGCREFGRTDAAAVVKNSHPVDDVAACMKANIDAARFGLERVVNEFGERTRQPAISSVPEGVDEGVERNEGYCLCHFVSR